MTFGIPLERKFNADQLLIKDLGLKMYGTEVMSSYSDATVNILNMKFYILLERKFDTGQFLTKDLGLKMDGTEVLMSHIDIVNSICRNLSLLNITIYVLFNK